MTILEKLWLVDSVAHRNAAAIPKNLRWKYIELKDVLAKAFEERNLDVLMYYQYFIQEELGYVSPEYREKLSDKVSKRDHNKYAARLDALNQWGDDIEKSNREHANSLIGKF